MKFKQHLLAAAAGSILWAAATSAWGQSALPPQTTDEALRNLADAAGVVFTGTVTAIRRPQNPTGVVEIDFAVADAVRGVSGNVYTLREWAGMWEATDEPFRPGQRYLMLLHAPNSAGLSSPVGGPDGAIPLRAASTATADTPTGTAFDTVAALADAGEQSVDLGWIAARVSTPVTYTHTTPARPILGTGAQSETSAPADAAASHLAGPDRLRTAGYGSVLRVLRGQGGFDVR